MSKFVLRARREILSRRTRDGVKRCQPGRSIARIARMDIDRIEEMIAECCSDQDADQDLQELLAVVAERHGIQPDDEELERGSRFVVGYVEQVPYMLKVARTAASNVGLEAEMEQILDMVGSYWLQDLDVIPDHLGLIGLLDDAYCSLTTLQSVSDHFRLQTGKYLFPDDLTAANRVMRKIIGDPYVAELDHFVSKALNEAGVIQALTALATPDKQRFFADQANIWNHGPAGSIPVDRMAALGLIED
jgi:uncharacterized membrane protein YkvA (DUF1232 family)